MYAQLQAVMAKLFARNTVRWLKKQGIRVVYVVFTSMLCKTRNRYCYIEIIQTYSFSPEIAI
jgi:hypothetical protein